MINDRHGPWIGRDDALVIVIRRAYKEGDGGILMGLLAARSDYCDRAQREPNS